MTEIPLLSLDIPSDADTQAFGHRLGLLLRNRDILALKGSLGMGKSTLARAAIRARAQNPRLEVPSPTFNIIQIYDLTPPVYHIDLYRLKDPDEAMELGLEEAFSNGISFIEWPERLGVHLPSSVLTCQLSETPTGGRRAELFGNKSWIERFDE